MSAFHFQIHSKQIIPKVFSLFSPKSLLFIFAVYKIASRGHCATRCTESKAIKPLRQTMETLYRWELLYRWRMGAGGHGGWRGEELWMLALVVKEASGRASHLTHIPIQLLPY